MNFSQTDGLTDGPAVYGTGHWACPSFFAKHRVLHFHSKSLKECPTNPSSFLLHCPWWTAKKDRTLDLTVSKSHKWSVTDKCTMSTCNTIESVYFEAQSEAITCSWQTDGMSDVVGITFDVRLLISIYTPTSVCCSSHSHNRDHLLFLSCITLVFKLYCMPFLVSGKLSNYLCVQCWAWDFALGYNTENTNTWMLNHKQWRLLVRWLLLCRAVEHDRLSQPSVWYSRSQLDSVRQREREHRREWSNETKTVCVVK